MNAHVTKSKILNHEAAVIYFGHSAHITLTQVMEKHYNVYPGKPISVDETPTRILAWWELKIVLDDRDSFSIEAETPDQFLTLEWAVQDWLSGKEGWYIGQVLVTIDELVKKTTVAV